MDPLSLAGSTMKLAVLWCPSPSSDKISGTTTTGSMCFSRIGSGFSCIPTAAAILGNFLGSWVSGRIGPKVILLLAALVTIAAVGMEFASTTLNLFMAGKTINEFSLGIIQAVGATYVSEISPLLCKVWLPLSVTSRTALDPTFVSFRIIESPRGLPAGHIVVHLRPSGDSLL